MLIQQFENLKKGKIENQLGKINISNSNKVEKTINNTFDNINTSNIYN